MGKNDGKRNPKNASKGGTQKQRGGIKKPKKVQQLRDVPLPEEEGANQEEDLEVSDEDLEFVREHGESIGFLKELNKAELDKSVKGSQKKDAARAQKGGAAAAAAAAAKAKEEEPGEEEEEEEEEEGLEAYERGPRRVAKEDEMPRTKGLPIKTMDGEFVYAKDEDHKHKGGNKAQHLAAMEMPKVEGVTVQDEMEESQKIKEAHKKAQEAQAAKEQQEAQKRKQKKTADAALPPALAQLQTLVDREQRLNKAKEAMAVAANALLSGPEDHIGELKTLTALLGDSDMQVSRLAMVSLLAVFKDIIPGYRIRPPTEKELEVKVSKEVQHLRDYEAALLRHYQAYLKGLLRHGLCVSQGSGPVAHARVAVRCMCQLLTTAPHFNYTSDLLQAVVPRMAASDAEIRNTACSAIRALLASPDTTGKVALEALQLVADLIRRRKCICPPQVVQALSVLRFNQVTRRDPEEKQQKGGKKKEANKKRPRNQIDEDVDRDFKESQAALDSRTISKLQSQMLEALFEIYFRVLKQCTASPLLQQDPQQQQTQQQQQLQQQQQQASNGTGPGKKKGKSAPAAPASSTIPDNLATAPSPGVSRARLLKKHPLLYPVLEGLACYTHLISVEYFNDIMDVFHQLLRSPGLPLLERLRVLLTASDILRGQGEALNVDRRESHARLYQALLSVPMSSLVDAELLADGGSSSSGKADNLGHQSNKDDENEDSDPPGTAEVAAVAAGGRVGGAAAETSGKERLVEEPLSVLLAGVLHQTVCEPKIVDVARLAAFTKRVATIAMDSGPAEALALLGCVLRLLRRYPRLKSLLEWEGEAPVGGRSFNPELADPSEAGALAAALWELQLLVHHYHPHVAQAAKSLIGLAPGTRGVKDSGDQQLSGPLATPGTLRDLATLYATIPRGGFLPPPQAPRSMPPGRTLPQAALRRALQQPVSEEWGQMLQHSGVAFRDSTTSSWAGSEGDELLGMAGSTGSGAGREEEEAAAAKALRSQYREARRFADNAGLRRERAQLIDQLKRFKVHLHQQHQAPQGVSKAQQHKRAKQK